MNPPAVLFADATKTVQAVLTAARLAVPVAGERVPNPRPAVFLRVTRTGGPASTIVTDAATLIVESWAGDEEAAMALAQRARQALHTAAGTVVAGSTVYTVDELSGPGQLPDPLSDQARVSQTFSITIRGS